LYQHEGIFDESVKLEVPELIASTSLLQYYSAFYEDPPTAILSELPATASLGSILDLGPSSVESNTVIARLPVRPARGWRYRHWYPKSEDGEEPKFVPFTFRVILIVLIPFPQLDLG
jgi:hypothetical protein